MTQDQVIRQFVESAEAFCSLIERHPLLTSEQFIRQSARILASLYQSVWELPNVETKGLEIVRYSGRNTEVVHGIGTKLGRFDAYWQVPDPFREHQPVLGTLVGDLAEIYWDIKDGLVFYSQMPDNNINDAIWHWRFTFITHWGLHLVDALRAVHRAVSDYINW
jgi:hypothetical protein